MEKRNKKEQQEWEDMLNMIGRDPQLRHLYKTHPNFDNYPQYMKDALPQQQI